MNTPVELNRYLSTLWRWGWLLIVATLLAGAASYLNSSRMPRTYRATTTLLVGQYLKLADPGTGDFAISQQLAVGYAQMVPHQPILQATIDALRLKMPWESLAENVSAMAVPGNSLILITVVDTDPKRAMLIANEVGHQLILQSPTPQDNETDQEHQFANRQVTDLQTRISDAQKQIDDLQNQLAQETSALRVGDIQRQITVLDERVTAWQSNYARLLQFSSGSRTNYVSVLEPASLPVGPIGPNKRLNVLLGAAIGFLLAAGATLLIEYFNDTLRTPDDVNRILGLPMIGSTANQGKTGSPSEALVGLAQPHSRDAEAYRVLRTNVQFALDGSPSPILLVTSPEAREAISVTAANLAGSFAQMGKRTVLVEADVRHPSVCSLWGVTNEVGLASIVQAGIIQERGQRLDDKASEGQVELGREDADLKRRLLTCLLPTDLPDLLLLPSGSTPANPADLLASARMEQLLRTLQGMADVIVLNGPPLLPVADARILAAKVTGVILVVEAGDTCSSAAHQAKEILLNSRACVLGVMLNKVHWDASIGQDGEPIGQSHGLSLLGIFRGKLSGRPLADTRAIIKRGLK